MAALDIGIILPAIGGIPPLATTGGIAAASRHIEDLGLESVWVPDLIIGDGTPSLESVVTLSVAAAATERVRLGFSVLVLPLRPAAWVAAQIGTLQHISGNRVLLGIGSGGFPSTPFWQATGVPATERGHRTDAALEVLSPLIAGEPTTLQHGEPAVRLGPATSRPPILVGGNSEVAIRRAATQGTAWFPSLITPDTLGIHAAKLHQLAAERLRATPGITVGGHAMLGSDEATRSVRDTLLHSLVNDHGMTRREAATIPMTGNSSEVAERFAAYAAAGADRLVLSVDGEDWMEQCELIADACALRD